MTDQTIKKASSGEPVDPGIWEHLVIAMLSVGGYPVEKVLRLRASLAQVGLLDPRNLSTWDDARVTRELTVAGYTRGMLTGMYAERLTVTMRVLAADGRLLESEAILSGHNEERIEQLLLPQKGVGRKVMDTFLSLRRTGEGASKYTPQ